MLQNSVNLGLSYFVLVFVIVLLVFEAGSPAVP